ncbi:hypothetical protein CYLTODRAFT_419971 [Cylindrobasidium torrendii FP15055 ss-10]|uniref:SHSP domain-containing protein n=1 Tax=Cylindrobasidium torrendii FP15055 ss-10 TaxID=1314674 RepID=A0A0D7BKW8_9AGAR|nr:hypothetical protein CYLTODRAFT_419971 [Cylindrobasidium torrendii FP15055 ss-10]
MTPTSKNMPALPKGIQQLVAHYSNLRIKEMASRGIITVNQSLYKARPAASPPQGNQVFMPRMDVYDNPVSLDITATFEIPGVKADDLSLTIKDGCLIVEGERRDPMMHCGVASRAQNLDGDSDDSDSMDVDRRVGRKIRVRTAVQELRHGRFHRAVPLPAGVQVSLFSHTHLHTFPHIIDGQCLINSDFAVCDVL